MFIKKILSTIFIFSTLLCTTNTHNAPYGNWDWRKIDICNISFPEDFLWATVQYNQEITHTQSNTTQSAWKKNFTTTCAPKDLFINGQKIAAELNLSGHAFSINWAAVEPYQGVYDQKVLDMYRQICEELHKNNIRPIITLKDHYSDPLWFGYINGFEKKENISIFQNYCLRVVQEIMHTNPIIITFQSPEMYAINGYYLKKLPPGKKNAQLVFDVLHHQLEAHTRVYHAIKKLSHNNPLQVGITKYAQPIKPYNRINPLDHISCAIIHELREQPFITWFTQGLINIYIPLVAKKVIKNSSAQKTLDFIGIDTDSHAYMNNFKCVINPNDIKTDIQASTFHPESLYYAIAYTHKQIAGPLDIPIYITQSGIGTSDETMRDLFFKRYLYALSKALIDGYNIKGYCYWSLFDGYVGTNQETLTGIVSYDTSQGTYKVKEGAQYFLQTISDR